jgi:hypothetical protein
VSSHHNNPTGEYYARIAHKTTFFAYMAACFMDFTAVLFSLLVAGFILFFHNNAAGGLIYLFCAFGSMVCFGCKLVMTFWHRHCEREHEAFAKWQAEQSIRKEIAEN